MANIPRSDRQPDKGSLVQSKSKSGGNPSDLQVLSWTVQAVNAALQGAVDADDDEPYALHNICCYTGNRHTWDATLEALPSDEPGEDDEGLCFPVRVAVRARDADSEDDDDDDDDSADRGSLSVELSLRKQHPFNVDLLWRTHAVEVAAALRWLRRRVSRGMRRGSSGGAGDRGRRLATVAVRLPAESPLPSLPFDVPEREDDLSPSSMSSPGEVPLVPPGEGLSKRASSASKPDEARKAMYRQQSIYEKTSDRTALTAPDTVSTSKDNLARSGGDRASVRSTTDDPMEECAGGDGSSRDGVPSEVYSSNGSGPASGGDGDAEASRPDGPSGRSERGSPSPGGVVRAMDPPEREFRRTPSGEMAEAAFRAALDYRVRSTDGRAAKGSLHRPEAEAAVEEEGGSGGRPVAKIDAQATKYNHGCSVDEEGNENNSNRQRPTTSRGTSEASLDLFDLIGDTQGLPAQKFDSMPELHREKQGGARERTKQKQPSEEGPGTKLLQLEPDDSNPNLDSDQVEHKRAAQLKSEKEHALKLFQMGLMDRESFNKYLALQQQEIPPSVTMLRTFSKPKLQPEEMLESISELDCDVGHDSSKDDEENQLGKASDANEGVGLSISDSDRGGAWEDLPVDVGDTLSTRERPFQHPSVSSALSEFTFDEGHDGVEAPMHEPEASPDLVDAVQLQRQRTLEQAKADFLSSLSNPERGIDDSLHVHRKKLMDKKKEDYGLSIDDSLHVHRKKQTAKKNENDDDRFRPAPSQSSTDTNPGAGKRKAKKRDSLAIHRKKLTIDSLERNTSASSKSSGGTYEMSESLIQNMRSSCTEVQVQMAENGLMSQKSMKQLIRQSLAFDRDVSTSELSELTNRDKEVTHTTGTGIDDSLRSNKSTASGSASEVPKDVIQNMKLGNRGSYPDGEVRMAKRGVMSRKTIKRLSNESPDAPPGKAPITEKHIEQAKMGLLSGASMAQLGIDEGDLRRAIQQHEAKSSEKGLQQQGKRRLSGGEVRMARMGIGSRRSMISFRQKGLIKTVSFSEVGPKNMHSDDTKTPENHQDSEMENDLIFSTNELKNQYPPKQDVLTQAQYYLGVSMLAYMYSHLRETCRMGHTRVKMEDIDVHSVQSQYRKGSKRRKYLDFTKTAGSIIRVVIDELDRDEDDDEEKDIIGNENKEYEQSITAQFRTWIEDSRVNLLDKETEKMITELKRKVARHRWRRAISAVRLSYRLSGGKRPNFDNSAVVAPGCENQNRFVDMKSMMSEAMRIQPKYFKEGSVMHNLIEGGMEMVWFSDMSQNDVVYGICVQREEKKVTVVFRGTVNAHNWRMNLKFDTNEYRNPVKQDYPGRADELSLHSGFALYLLRKRKDTGMSKLQEIMDKIDEIGREMAPDGDYQLSITGHSLGGALATLCGFYVAARSRFANLSTIYVWTFAAPRVGTVGFMNAYQYLEKTRRIKHARISITQDLVPLVPFCNFEMDDLQFYKHVGMRVQLHGIGRLGRWLLKRKLDVTYPLDHNWQSEIRRAFRDSIFFNLTTVAGFKKNHTITEYQKRLNFAKTYRKALGSGELFLDKKRNRIKTLDEYYQIRANVPNDAGDSSVERIMEQDKPRGVSKDLTRPLILILVALLMGIWVALVASVMPGLSSVIISPFASVASSIWHVINMPVKIPVAIYKTAPLQAKKALHYFSPTICLDKIAFTGVKNDENLNKLFSELSVERSGHSVALVHQKALSSARDIIANSKGEIKLQVFDRTAKSLLNLAALLDDGANSRLTIVAPEGDEQANLTQFHVNGTLHGDDDSIDGGERIAEELRVAESKLKALQEYATGVTFPPKLDDDLYLVGTGVRKKSIIKVYAVAMYSSAAVLNAVSSPRLGNAARTFDSSTPVTTFVLEMVYSVGAEKIAGAIAESVKPRYGGSLSDIQALESLIVQGVSKIGGQATKGTIFRFDCSMDGVSVTVGKEVQGIAAFYNLGSAFVDVFMDDDAVSPTLVNSCIETWSGSESKALSSLLLELTDVLRAEQMLAIEKEAYDQEKNDQRDDELQMAESKLKPLQEYATGVTFAPKIDDRLYLVGTGVRKKSIIKVYAVAMYSSAAVLNADSSMLGSAARTFDSSTPVTTFVLEMVYSVGAEKIAGAIAESVKPRYGGSLSDIQALESLIVQGVSRIGGQATKGTIFRFDCSIDGVSVSVDEELQGIAAFDNLGSAFVDVFMDDNAVSPTLVNSCIETWSGSESQALSSLLHKLTALAL